MSDAAFNTTKWAQAKTMEITARAGFRVEDILLEGRRNIDSNTLKAIVNVEKGDPIFGFDPDATQEMLQKVSWVKNVRVERRFPNKIYIKIEERVPMALWQRDKRLSLIDTEGVVLTDHKLEKFKDYIVVVGEGVPEHAPEFLQLLMAESEIVKKMEAASLRSERRWDLVLKSGAIVKMPEDDVAVALSRLNQMHQEKQILDKDVKTIDVREPARILVRTHPGAVQQYQAGYNDVQSSNGDAI